MLDKFLLAVVVANLSFISVLTPKAIAQERPKCYLIDESGELTDLSDICNVSQQETSDTTTNEGENVVNNNINIVNSDSASTKTEVTSNKVKSNDGFVVGADNSSRSSGTINSSYLIDNELGVDYTAYVRRYKASPNSFDRLTRREQIFRFNDRNRSHTSILRRGRSELPFLIYRYQI